MRIDQQPLSVLLQTAELRRVMKRELFLFGCDDLHEHDLMPSMPEPIESRHQRLNAVEAIAEDHH